MHLWEAIRRTEYWDHAKGCWFCKLCWGYVAFNVILIIALILLKIIFVLTS